MIRRLVLPLSPFLALDSRFWPFLLSLALLRVVVALLLLLTGVAAGLALLLASIVAVSGVSLM